MGDGNWTIAAYIDERADEQQTAALGAIFSGAEGGPMAAFAPLVGKHLGVKKAAIKYAITGKSPLGGNSRHHAHGGGAAGRLCIRVARFGRRSVIRSHRTSSRSRWAPRAAPLPTMECAGTIPAGTAITRRSAGRTNTAARAALLTFALFTACVPRGTTSMVRVQTDPISYQRNVILGLLLALAAAAWAALVWQGAGADMDMPMHSPTMGLRAPLFLMVWVIMMVAMMFPTAAPMIVVFHKVQAGKRQRGEAFVSTWIFVAAYLLVWGLSGVAAYAGAVAAEAFATRTALSPATAARVGGTVLVAAGLYQLTPLKDSVSLEVPHAHHVHHDIVARRCCGCAAHGTAPRCLLPWLLLAPVRHLVSARHHEYCRHGGYHACNIRRENIAMGSCGGSRRGGCTHSVWLGGRGGATTPADIPFGPGHGQARRDADADAWERYTACHAMMTRRGLAAQITSNLYWVHIIGDGCRGTNETRQSSPPASAH